MMGTDTTWLLFDLHATRFRTSMNGKKENLAIYNIVRKQYPSATELIGMNNCQSMVSKG